jgi:hypothetical protein
MKEEKIEGMNIWMPQKIGEQLIGKIKRIEADAQFGIQATIRQQDGIEVLTPSHRWLQNCLKRLETGNEIKIVYDGEEPPKVKGQSPTRKYSVYRLSEE